MTSTTHAAAADERSRGTLRRELRFWEAIAISVGIMAPTAAMALNGVAPAGLVGRAVPQTSPSPCAAWVSPSEKSAPSTPTGR